MSDIELVAYCFMADHVHLLIEGRTENADALTFGHQDDRQHERDAQIAGSRTRPSVPTPTAQISPPVTRRL